MNILDSIIDKKKLEVEERKQIISVTELEKRPMFRLETLSLTAFLSDTSRSGIIAEFKRKSPSRGVINDTSTVTEVTGAYAKYGASGISVLTDEYFFGGSLNDLVVASDAGVPLLRKDFIVDEYQLIESKAFGAGVILLIAACLKREEVEKFAATAKSIGLNVLLEVHSQEELAYIGRDIDVVGVNNRDLKTFVVDINHSLQLGKEIPAGVIKISESGIDDPKAVRLLRNHGFSGFLVGEKFMKEKDPGEAFKKFVAETVSVNTTGDLRNH